MVEHKKEQISQANIIIKYSRDHEKVITSNPCAHPYDHECV